MAPTSSSSQSPLNPLDADPQTPLQQRLPRMPRAPPTPIPSDDLQLGGGPAAPLPIINPNPPHAAVSVPPISIHGVHISDYIPFTVSTSGSNFSRWRQFIVFLLTLYKAMDHVTEGAAPADPDDTWRQVDITISLWFLATLAPDLLRLVQGPNACSTWTRLHRFFLANKASRHLYLSKAFRSTPRGDMDIATYASRLQGLADDLEAIGAPVSDEELTLQFIDGLGKKFELQAEVLQTALPSFADACSRLQIAEIAIDAKQRSADTQVMVAHDSDEHGSDRGSGSRGGGQHGGGRGNHGGGGRGGGQNGGGGRGNHGGGHQGGYYGGGGRGGGRGNHGGGGRGGGRGNHGGGQNGGGRGGHHGGSGGGHQQPWMGYFAPVGTPFPPARPPWVSPNAAGVLGPRPGLHSHAYPVMHQPPQPYYVPPYSFDQAAMIHGAVSNSAHQQPEWIMDSGASSHVTGPSYQDPPSSLQ